MNRPVLTGWARILLMIFVMLNIRNKTYIECPAALRARIPENILEVSDANRRKARAVAPLRAGLPSPASCP